MRAARKTAPVLLVAACAALFASAAAAQPVKPASAGVYTDAQAARGAVEYDQNCARCHGHALVGTYDEPSLKGKLMSHWNGATLDGLFAYMSTAMPLQAPGALSPAVNADILAYILKSNGFPAGTRELDPVALKSIRLDPQFPPPAK